MATPPNQLNPSDYSPATWAAYLVAYNAWVAGGRKGTPPADPPKQGIQGQIGGDIATGAQAISDVPGAIVGFSNTLVKLVTRILEAAVGVVLLAIAANAILKQTTGVDVAGTAARTGKKVAGTAAKAAVVA